MSKIAEAFQAIRREDFLPEHISERAALDAPLPIGYGQTISQPSTVAMMLEWLDPQPDQKILDVGFGTGWSTALLSYLAGPRGKIYGVEKSSELLRFGTENCRKAGIRNAHFFEAGTTYGLPEHAPYDRILVSAAADEMPREFLKQLRVGGRLVIPVLNSIHVIDKIAEDRFNSSKYGGFAFVPLV